MQAQVTQIYIRFALESGQIFIFIKSLPLELSEHIFTYILTRKKLLVRVFDTSA